MAAVDKLLPVTLPSWPGCNDCISWSEDDIAVAGSEFVHILTPKTSAMRSETAGHPQWHISSPRINLFTQDEWPERNLTSINALSIGEEQSNSYAVNLAWSCSGLGVHRRCVLAVLTSNLVLSLWETGGNQLVYQRTCVVNKAIAPGARSDGSDDERRALRIRCFSWLPLLKTSLTSKWGFHYLVVAHDNDNMTLLRVSKTKGASLGQWELKPDLTLGINDFELLTEETTNMSPLQKRLDEQSPISRVNISPWHSLAITRKEDIALAAYSSMGDDALLCKMTITKGRRIYTTLVCSQVSADGRRVSLASTLR